MAFRFCLIVCLVTTPVTWSSIGVAGPNAGCSAVATPTHLRQGSGGQGRAQILREAAKTTKTFSTSWLAAADIIAVHRPAPITNDVVRQIDTASSLSLDTPPLAPRPPPHA